jgi:serine protease AprX
MGRRGIAVVAAISLILAVIGFGSVAPASTDDTPMVSVVVREADPPSSYAEALVKAGGGSVDQALSIIGGFSATIPANLVSTLSADPAIEAVTPNADLQLLATKEETNTLTLSPISTSKLTVSSTEQWVDSSTSDKGFSITHAAFSMFSPYFTHYSGADGSGVDVALIDSGVVPVEGLTTPGKVINGPDLSFESQNEKFRHLDTYGHGTHMAGIIAGADAGLTGNLVRTSTGDFDEYTTGFTGIAPGARIVSVKVAGHDGATDVSQVLAAIDWVVQHKNDNGMNIRVLNLSFGTDSTQSYVLDPLAFAVEQAWKAGIVVVVAAGNDGNAAPLRNPAIDPFVIAVGATDTNGTYKVADDYVTDFSNCGTAERHVDLVAPGRSIRSLTAPGARADVENPNAAVGDRLLRGTGTSQSAAMVSGAVALLLDRYPSATPDQIKALLMNNAWDLANAKGICEGAGAVSLYNLWNVELPKVEQTHTPSTGTGSLHASRGSMVLESDGVALTDEQDIFGNKWNGVSWSTAAAQGVSWSGGDWNGVSWSGVSWSGTSWSGVSWSGVSWSGTSWSGVSWSGTSWSDKSWNGVSWSGTSWSGTSWSGISWSSSGWSGASWR